MKNILILLSAFCFLAPTILPAQGKLLDLNFGDQGIVKTSITDHSVAYALLMQNDEKIIAAGTSSGGSFTLARYDKQGQLDPTFGSEGLQIIPFSQQGAIYALAQQSDQKIIAAGFVSGENGDDFALMRFLPDGMIDYNFGQEGQVRTHFQFFDGINAIALQSDEKIVVAGSVVVDNLHTFALARYHQDGTLDQSFGKSGTLTTSLFPAGSGGHSLAIQDDGKIVVAGFAVDGSNFNFDFALLRYLTDGSIDPTFGEQGQVVTDFDAGPDAAYTLAIKADKKIVVGGIADNDFALAQYFSDGELDASFGTEGLLTIDFGGQDGINAIALQSNGKIVAAGYSFQEEDEDLIRTDFAVARIQADGLVEQKFTHHISGISIANDLLLQQDGKVLTAGFSTQEEQRQFTLTRYLPALTAGITNPSANLNLSLSPNPINTTTVLDYHLSSASKISIQLYDLQGKYLQTFVPGITKGVGRHQEVLDFGATLPGGTYSVVIESELGRASVRAVKVE